MRNIDKIKSLEKELGKYRKKVTDQDKIIRKLSGELERAHAGAIQLQAATDAVLTAAALAHGEAVQDEESGKSIGWRLRVPLFSIREMRGRYEIHARRDEEEAAYILGVVERKEPETP